MKRPRRDLAGPTATLLALLAAGMLVPTGAGTAELEDAQRRIEAERARRGLAPLARDPRLDAAAAGLAGEIARDGATYPTLSAAFQASLGAEGRELLPAIEAAGYRAASGRALLVVGGETAAEAFDRILDGDDPVSRGLADPDSRDVGIGFARMGDTPLWVVVFALSEADDFARRTRGLADLEAVREELTRWTVEARAEHGRGALERDPCLERVAQAYADRMLAEGFYDHRDPDGEGVMPRVRAGGCAVRAVAENLALGPESPEEAIGGWLASPVHRGPLLDPRFHRVGFGVAYGDSPAGRRILWVQLLA